jgi:acyl-CoA dehydrogenase
MKDGRRPFWRGGKLDFNLPEELKLLQSQLRRFIDNELIPHEKETFADVDALKPEWRDRFVRSAKALGIWMMEVPEEYGGTELSMLGRTVVWQELARSFL